MVSQTISRALSTSSRTKCFLLRHLRKQVFHCFGCGAGGDLLAFVSQFHACTFWRALKIVDEFLTGSSRQQAAKRLAFWRERGGDSPLSSPQARNQNSQLSSDSRALLIEALDRTNRRLKAIRKANLEAAVILATPCEPWTEERLFYLRKQNNCVDA